MRVPVLSKMTVSASLTFSMYLPPFTVTRCRPASRMADRTLRGMESFRAQEKSTISTLTARAVFPVSSQVRRLPPRHQGTSLSARRPARLSTPDFSRWESSIMRTIRS